MTTKNNSEEHEAEVRLETFDGQTVDTMGRPKKSESWYTLGFVVLVELLCVVLTVMFIFWTFDDEGVTLFAWHPTLMAIGIIFLMSEAILVYAEYSLISRSVSSYKKKVTIHWVLQVGSLICVSLAFLAIEVVKYRNNKINFNTNHGKVGLVTFICIVLTACGGIFAKYSFPLRKCIRPVCAKILHSIAGLISMILSAATILLVVCTGHWWHHGHKTELERYFAIGAIVIIWVYVFIRPITELYRRLRQMYSSI